MAVLAVLSPSLVRIPSAAAEEARPEQSGTLATSLGVDFPQFVVTIGRPEFDDTRAPLVPLVGLYQANAVQWLRRADTDGVWVRLEYEVPVTSAVSLALDPQGLEAITHRRDVPADELPIVVGRLPSVILSDVASFLQFYSGAFRIYLREQSEEKAAEMAAALNRGRARTPEVASSGDRGTLTALDHLMAHIETYALMNPLCADVKREATDLALEAAVAAPKRRVELIHRIFEGAKQCKRSFSHPSNAY